MRRFFITPPADDQQLVILDKEESRHLVRVLRVPVGEEIEMLDGSGGRYHGRIESLGKEVAVRLLRREILQVETGCPLWVCQGDLKGKKMDELVEKCTELGVERFIPFFSSRSQGRVSGERIRRRRERRRHIVRAACKQSGRMRLMQVESEQEFTDLLELEGLPESAVRLLFWEQADQVRLAEYHKWCCDRPICLLLGPEGGFSAVEATEAQRHGWRLVSLGSRILRAETATIAAVSIIQHRLGVI